MFRIVGPADEVLEALHAARADRRDRGSAARPDGAAAYACPGLPPRCFPFTTDVPLLDAWGTPLLFGPGSILVAHTDEEHLAIDELAGAIDTNERIVRRLLG